MKIRSLHIKNFKSIVDLEIIEPNPFTVFVGPNGAGKSNIFEALEYRLFGSKMGDIYVNLADLFPNVYSYNPTIEENNIHLFNKPGVEIFFNTFKIWDLLMSAPSRTVIDNYDLRTSDDYRQFVDNHSEIFISNINREKISFKGDGKLSTSCSNLEKVLKRILKDPAKEEDILEWLQLLIPEFQNIEIDSDNKLKIREKYSTEPFDKELISDGTYNILALLTAVYQSDEPQFLCIEEPENGLHPEVIKELVGFFRAACADKGHYIWLNTHSTSLVSALRPEEIILVNKRQGETQIKQLKGKDLHGLTMDEAWLSNALGGGLTW